MGESGHIVWPGPAERIWELTWNLPDAPDQEGITISQARYRGHGAIYKASVPLLRVQYAGACGPYRIPLNYNSTRYADYTMPITFDLGRHKIWEVEQRWVFWEDGEVFARINGLTFDHCASDRRYHAYFRFDFDIDTAGNNLALEYNSTTCDLGWGRGWHGKATETSRVRNRDSNRSWLVLNKASRRGYHVVAPGSSGPADAFANRDVWVVRYHGQEDLHGNQGSAYADDLQNLVNGEDVDGKDVVIWYCHHHTPRWNDQRGGPNLQVVGNWT